MKLRKILFDNEGKNNVYERVADRSLSTLVTLATWSAFMPGWPRRCLADRNCKELPTYKLIVDNCFHPSKLKLGRLEFILQLAFTRVSRISSVYLAFGATNSDFYKLIPTSTSTRTTWKARLGARANSAINCLTTT